MKAYQMDLFGALLPEYGIKNKIRLIECFGGIGAQARALEVLQDKGLLTFEHHRLVEWAVPSIIAYNAIHIHDWKDYSQGKSVEELVRLTDGISVNYNEPMTDKQRLKKGEKWLRKVYSAMVATHDLCPDISKTHWDDLGITERERYTYILTYSFPCQDLSAAGAGAGFKKGSGTRSGLLWEIERILLECEGRDCLPHVLLMENVKQVMSDSESWSSWDSALRKMGYTNYVKVLNAKDYGIPQNRERCFMVSILGEYAYDFPIPFKRKHNLKDFLDGKVDKKYYLSDEHLRNIAGWKAQQKPIESMEKRKDCAPTLTARGAGEEHSGMVLVKDKPPAGDDILTVGKHGLGQAIAEKEVSNSIRVGGRGSLDRHQWDMVVDEEGD